MAQSKAKQTQATKTTKGQTKATVSKTATKQHNPLTVLQTYLKDQTPLKYVIFSGRLSQDARVNAANAQHSKVVNLSIALHNCTADLRYATGASARQLPNADVDFVNVAVWNNDKLSGAQATLADRVEARKLVKGEEVTVIGTIPLNQPLHEYEGKYTVQVNAVNVYRQGMQNVFYPFLTYTKQGKPLMMAVIRGRVSNNPVKYSVQKIDDDWINLSIAVNSSPTDANQPNYLASSLRYATHTTEKELEDREVYFIEASAWNNKNLSGPRAVLADTVEQQHYQKGDLVEIVGVINQKLKNTTEDKYDNQPQASVQSIYRIATKAHKKSAAAPGSAPDPAAQPAADDAAEDVSLDISDDDLPF